MFKKIKKLIFIFVITIFIIFGYTSEIGNCQDNNKRINTEINIKEKYQVVKVIDGDTIEIELLKSKQKEKIRMIGVDTPETVDPRKPLQCFGKEASNNTKKLLLNKYVYLEKDPLVGERDKYNRLLRYVFFENDINFNEFIIKQGFAYEYTYKKQNYKYQSKFKIAEKEARENKKGLWADEVCENKKDIVKYKKDIVKYKKDIAKSVGTYYQKQDKTKCSCSKDIYNCKSFKTQKEAQTLFNCCGGIKNDIHKLDRNKDGIVCETLK
jgi:micrococcal nuclease